MCMPFKYVKQLTSSASTLSALISIDLASADVMAPSSRTTGKITLQLSTTAERRKPLAVVKDLRLDDISWILDEWGHEPAFLETSISYY